MGQIIVTSTQLMTQYANEYFDYNADVVNPNPTPWSGGSRVLPAGGLPRRVALFAALFLMGIAGTTTLLLLLTQNPPPLSILIIVLAGGLAWGYSAPPLALNWRGWGEISASVVVSGLTPLLGFYLQAGEVHRAIIGVILPLFGWQFAMLLSVHLPDMEGDALVGKQTLVVRYGRDVMRRWYQVALIVPYIILAIGGWDVPMAVRGAMVLPLPLAIGLFFLSSRWLQQGNYGRLAFWSIGLLMGSAGLAVGALLWLIGV